MASHQNKLRKAAQALLKNQALFITSGSGMGVDSGLPYFRGTQGLWAHYPIFKKEKITFDDFVQYDFFKYNPHRYWYVYG